MQCLFLSASLTVIEVAPPFCHYRLNCLPDGRISWSAPAFKLTMHGIIPGITIETGNKELSNENLQLN